MTGTKGLRRSGSYLPSSIFPNARVVEWQTRTFEGRMPKGMRVQVPPRAPLILAAEMATMVADCSKIAGTADCRSRQ